MGDPAIGWIAAIILGGIAGWLAERFMKSDMSLLMNVVLGIVGAAVASGPNLTFRFAWGFPGGLVCASLRNARANEHPIERFRAP